MRAFDAVSMGLDGTRLVEASAGTGKTYTLSTLVLRLIAERGLPLQRILVVTFTEAATAELRVRVGARIRWLIAQLQDGSGGDPLVEALLPRRELALDRLVAALRFLDESAIHTIHGFCHRMLLEHAYESGLSLESELVTDDRALLREAARAYYGTRVLTREPAFHSYLERNKLGPAQIENLAQELGAHPEAQVEGADTTPPPGGPPDEQAAFAAARDVWLAERGTIERLLFDALPGFSKRSYDAVKLERWLNESQTAFESRDTIQGKLPDWVERLGAAWLKKGTKKAFEPPQHRFFELLDSWAEVRDAVEAYYAQTWRAVLFEAAEVMLERVAVEKRRLGLMSFDDLLSLMHGAVCGRTGGAILRDEIAGRFDAALIDEFQDTDTRQYEIFGQLFNDGRRPFFMVGDPKQSIYRFRGADIHAYLRAAKEAGDGVYTLDTNWRSDAGLVTAVNTLFSSAEDPFADPAISFERVESAAGEGEPIVEDGPRRAPFDFLIAESLLNRNGAAAMTARDIEHLLAGQTREIDGLRGGDIAVLTRSNADAELMAGTLYRRGIPAVVTSARSVFSTEEARDLLTILSAVAQPHRRGLLRAALGTSLLGCDAEYIGTLVEDQRRYERLNGIFKSWHTKWKYQGIEAMLGAVFATTLPRREGPGLLELLSLPDGSRRHGSYLQLVSLLQNRYRDKRSGMFDLCRWLGMKIRPGESAADENEQLASPADDDAVRVMTIHKSKGLEFPVVYCPFVSFTNQRTDHGNLVVYHAQSAGGGPRIDCGSEDFDEHCRLAEAEARAEERRMLYVALTRAKRHCVAVLAPTKTLYLSALAAVMFEEPAQVKDASGAFLKARVETLANASEGRIGLREVGDLSRPPASLAATATPLRVRPIARRVEQVVFWNSFSSVVRDVEERRFAQFNGGSEVEGAHEGAVPGTPALFGDFERGALAGNCLHKIYELAVVERGDIESLVRRCLGEFGFDADTWAGPVVEGIERSRGFKLFESSPLCRLADVEPAHSARELPFLIKMGHGTDAGGLTVTALASLVRDFTSGQVDDAYTELLRDLSLDRLRGFWRGYIDLIFEHQGRYYVVDYKSNHLGSLISDYSDQAIATEMKKHHYYLQGLFYSLALHRHLTCHLPDYDYETHFGGALFLFVRGLKSVGQKRHGVFQGRLSKVAMDEFVSRTGGEAP